MSNKDSAYDLNSFNAKIFSIQTESEFESVCLEVFQYQYEYNAIYKQYVDFLGKNTSAIKASTDIPFLPIQFFKSHRVVCGNFQEELHFTSSGTTGSATSHHYVKSAEVYETSFLKAFEAVYGSTQKYCILALLPSYLERGGSSLVYMANKLIQDSKHPKSGFYLHNYSELLDLIYQLESENQPVLLLGVSYALLDLAEQCTKPLKNTIIMETGGMKGKRKEMIKSELHAVLSKGFGVKHIHSEYGMTELLSQAYSTGFGVFTTPPWMKIITRSTTDPFDFLGYNRTGGINVIDLANYNSCSFIETQDLGKLHSTNTFSIAGRFDNSDIRGCNLLVEI